MEKKTGLEKTMKMLPYLLGKNRKYSPVPLLPTQYHQQLTVRLESS
jgi:hypothetical protein